MDHHAEHSLPHGRRRLLHVAGAADHVPHSALRDDVVALGAWSSEGVLHPAAGARSSDDRRLRLARPVPLLFLLGSDADPDGPADRRIRPRPAHLRGSEILPLHHDCVSVHAGGNPLALRAHRHLRLHPDPAADSERPTGTGFRCEMALPGILLGFRRQSADVPLPHVAA